MSEPLLRWYLKHLRCHISHTHKSHSNGLRPVPIYCESATIIPS